MTHLHAEGGPRPLPPAGAAGAAVPAAHARRSDPGRDTRLHRARRLDWRFLLADPALGHVAVLGDDDPELVRALRAASGSLSLLDLGWEFPPGQEPRFDLVVLRSCRVAHAARAAALVRPGGSLYWEIDRRLNLRQPRAWLHCVRRGGARLGLGAIRAVLERHGLRDIGFHWHRPDFTSAVEIIPLGDGAILDYVFGGRGHRVRGRALRLLGRLLHHAGVLERVVPFVSVAAAKPAAASENA